MTTNHRIPTLIFALILSLPLLTGCFGGGSWKAFEAQYGTEVAERYRAGTTRPDLITDYGGPTSTFVWTENGWPSTMDSYVESAIKRLEKNTGAYVYRVDTFQKFWSQHRQNQGNFERYEDLVFYDEYNDVIGAHRRNI